MCLADKIRVVANNLWADSLTLYHVSLATGIKEAVVTLFA